MAVRGRCHESLWLCLQIGKMGGIQGDIQFQGIGMVAHMPRGDYRG